MIDPEARNALRECLGARIEFDAQLSRHTSLRMGGPADAIATPADREELCALLGLCAKYALPTLVIGAGFNLLVGEEGLRSVVIRLKKLRRIERVSDDLISVEAGASHATITRFCIDNALSGLEFGAGIPGTLGGWLAMNAGIGVREMKDVVREIKIVGCEGKRVSRIPRSMLEFGYRELTGLPASAIILSAKLQVEESDRAKVQSEIDRLLAHRQSTQPTDTPSCGSVFRNPPGQFAGQLIEAAGLKGSSVGAAEISSVHANFIVNHGGATASDVLQLIERAREAVERETGIRLETEVQIIGRSPGEDS
ncbi:MAG TPA: UDP-N-acetylmuramate dehydrogenase [Myxococcales bacterium]|nr:UDP-N-acetylmuramate dehydrogenase [Myxococcales bacterium]HIK84420.1 UDP-N-acetylmuramate dehydrogenase [Myxococcales bacterium]